MTKIKIFMLAAIIGTALIGANSALAAKHHNKHRHCTEQTQCDQDKRGAECDSKDCNDKDAKFCPFAGLNLTDAQKEKVKAIEKERRNAVKEGKKNVREEAYKNADNQIQQILTPEQYKQYQQNKETLRKERKDRKDKKRYDGHRHGEKHREYCAPAPATCNGENGQHCTQGNACNNGK